MAELRELKMVPAALRRSLRTRQWDVVKSEIPKQFTLNTGHVKFFFDKLWYLRTRYFQLVSELLKRGYKLDPDNINFDEYLVGLPKDSLGDYQPTPEALAIVRERIALRISQKPHLYGKTEYKKALNGSQN